MSDPTEIGVLYTEHVRARSHTPLASLWSYETRRRERGRPPVMTTLVGTQEYWLDRSDPLLNTVLPGTAVSVILNFGDRWATGRSLIAAELMPRVCVMGPMTQPRLLRIGKTVRAIGAVLPSVLASCVFGMPASELVDRVVPLDECWPHEDVARLSAVLSDLDVPSCLALLRDELVAHLHPQKTDDAIGRLASQHITRVAGRVSIEALAASHDLSRQQFTRQFRASAGLSPKLFARITRFQATVHALLSTDVAEWAVVAPALGFFDQAHMINEFCAFTGHSPRAFFRPHDEHVDAARIQVRGRPHEWLRRPEPSSASSLGVGSG